MTIAHIKRIILEELRKIITSKADVNITKIDNKLVEYGISNIETRKLLIKKLISNSNISEALLMEAELTPAEKKLIDSLKKNIPTDPGTIRTLYKLYKTGSSEDKKTIENNLNALFLKGLSSGDIAAAAKGGTLFQDKKGEFRRKINKIVGLDKSTLDSITTIPTSVLEPVKQSFGDTEPTDKKSEKPAPAAAPTAEPSKSIPKATPTDPDLEYLNKLQNMNPGELRKIGLTLSKDKDERNKVMAALSKAPDSPARQGLARKLGLNPKNIDAPTKGQIPTPAAPAAPTATKPPAAPSKAPTATKPPATPPKAPTATKPSAAPPKAAPPKPKKKRKPFVMTPAKGKKLQQKYKDFTDGGDDKQISKKFTVSKGEKGTLPKFGKVGKQTKGGSEKQAAARDTAASPFVSGEKPSRQLGDKGDSVPCLRGRKMDAGAKAKRETVGLTIMGGGVDEKGAPLAFGKGRWKNKKKGAFGNSPEKRQVADGKSIKAVLNFMGAAARFGYEPTKYWPNFLWATATDIVLKGQPKSAECGDPRNPKDVEKHRKQQRAGSKSKETTKEGYIDGAIHEETQFDSGLPRLPEDYCFEGCSDEQISEASKRNVKMIQQYKKKVADLRQQSKGMNLDQFLNLIKYKD